MRSSKNPIQKTFSHTHTSLSVLGYYREKFQINSNRCVVLVFPENTNFYDKKKTIVVYLKIKNSPNIIVKIQMHKGIVMTIDEHNLTIERKLDIFRSDHHFQTSAHTYRQIYDRRLTILVQLTRGNPVNYFQYQFIYYVTLFIE